ncbi:hypothetical protein KJ855_03640, partial [Patescibacteria group bacterium]|nr:hypothetical protein [Patescibacteria group bacterium]
MKRSEVIINFSLVFVDVLMIILGFVLAYYVRIDYSGFVPVKWVLPIQEYLAYIILFIPVWLVVFTVMGLYNFRGIASFVKEMGKVILAVSAMVSLMIIIIFFNRDQFFSRLIIIYAWLFVAVMVMVGRFAIRSLQRFLYKYGIGARRVLIVGMNKVAMELIEYIDDHKKLGWELVGIVDENKQKGEKVGNHRILGKIDRLKKIHRRYFLDEVWLTED